MKLTAETKMPELPGPPVEDLESLSGMPSPKIGSEILVIKHS